jgi:acyl dehydratase
MALVANLVHQRAMLASLAGVALDSLREVLRPGAANAAGSGTVELPGPELRVELPSPPVSLIRDYVAHVRGNAKATAGTIPPHFFPQFSMPLAAATLRGLPYPIHRIMNAGCRLEIRAPLLLGEPLTVRARLEGIDDNGRRALLHQRIVTGQRSSEEALVAHLYTVVPLASRGSDAAKKKKAEPARVPADAVQIDTLDLKRKAGLDFALLTGDFNPVHWLPPYARALGHRGTLLHGFASMARAYEALERSLSNDASRHVRMLDVRFVRPLVLPTCVGVYRRGDEVYVGLRGEPAHVTGTAQVG